MVKTNSGGMTLSNRLPRRQAATAPITVPRMNARMVLMPTRPRVHGRAAAMTWLTGSPWE